MSFKKTFDTVFVTPHAAGFPFLIGSAIILVLGAIFSSIIFWIGLIAFAVCFFFFRDPERIPPKRVGVFLAPADGSVTEVSLVTPPEEFGLAGECWRISIFLSFTNVHVNRMPVSGVIKKISYKPGTFVNALLHEASDTNERNAIIVELQNGSLMAVVQIAGFIARRIVCTVAEGQTVQAGERFGIIRFGSRTDLYLPKDIVPCVEVGQTMVGGETVVAQV